MLAPACTQLCWLLQYKCKLVFRHHLINLGTLLPAPKSKCLPCAHPLLQYYLTDQVDDNCKKGLLLTVTIK